MTGGAFGSPEALVCVTDFPPQLDTAGETVVVTTAGRKLTFSRKALSALKILLSGQPARLAEVTDLTGVDAAVLADVLLEEGVCAEMTDALSSAYTALA